MWRLRSGIPLSIPKRSRARALSSALVCAVAGALLCVSLAVPRAAASGTAAREFQRAAYAADFAAGISNLDAILTAYPDDADATFAKGALEVFAAFATLQKNLYDHSPGEASHRGLGFAGMMMGMAPGSGAVALLPPNPGAQPMTYAKLRGFLARFADDLAAAEATLGKVGEREVKLPLKPFKIAIDLNHDGQIAPGERLLAPLFMAGDGWARQARDPAILETELAFDTADASWLKGYVNVFLASTNALLAFDFERSYDAAAHMLYGLSATPFGRELLAQMERGRDPSAIARSLDNLDAELRALDEPAEAQRARQERLREIDEKLQALGGDNGRDGETAAERRRLLSERADLFAQARDIDRRRSELRNERRRLEAERNGELPGGDFDAILDLVAYIHTMRWPVVEPHRLEAARLALRTVMTQNALTWKLVRGETDDDREWLPNPRQTPPFGAAPLTDTIIDSWLRTTELATDVLDGRKLLPHPRFVRGVNLRRFFETAREVDLVLLLTGHALHPYLQDGEIVDGRTWRILTDPMGRDFPTFAVWFN